ncbi:MAG: GT4 family glycosyltransferase PelF [Microthrixaceae bacterium]|nr:GT4 family glycosyltransferase PelF [Microthrixaceae bacterium]
MTVTAPLTPARLAASAMPVVPNRSAATPGPKVALVTEGTYPFVQGGVSTWCDQMISSLPESSFEVVSIVSRSGNTPVWELPANVKGVTELGFWESSVPGERPRYLRAAGRSKINRRVFGDVVALLGRLTEPDADPQGFDSGLDALIEHCEARQMAPALRCRAAVEVLTDLCRSNGLPTSMAEVIQCLELLEHFLRPAGLDLPEADIYHATGNGLAALVAIAGVRRTGAPLVLSEHGVYLRERYLEYLGGDLGASTQRILLRFHRLLTIAAYRRADVIVPVTEFNKRWELRNGAEPSRVRVVNNGVDPSQFEARQARRPSGRRPTVGFLSRIDRIKDPLTLIHAASHLVNTVPRLSVRIWGRVADGQLDYDQECRDAVERLGLGGVVRFEGHTDDPAAAYRSVDVLVSCSVSEGLPYGILEAMMGATPIVSTNVGGLPEALDGVAALVEPGDPEQLADAIEHLLVDARRASELGLAARRRALTRFTLLGMSARYRKIYADLCRSIDLRDGWSDVPPLVDVRP